MHNKQTLANGVRILSEKLDHVRSASIGIWVGSGSRHEPADVNGISHFIEHMAFKGTAERTAAELAEEMDAIGGQVNAFTTKECTCFYARVLDSNLTRAVDLLSDMFFRSKFDEADVTTECGVILEEIGMYEDSPEDLVNELFFKTIYRGTPLAQPILGTAETLAPMTGSAMRGYLASNYSPDRTLVSLCGSYSERDLERIGTIFSAMPGTPGRRAGAGRYTAAAAVKQKDTEQNHLVLGFPGLTFTAPERYAASVLSSILGGGMSSRLFRRVREERGLCYSIYSFMSPHADAGAFGVYTATNRETEADALRLIREELDRMLEDGATAAELDRAREQAKSSILLGLESTVSRMNSMARGELFTGEITTADEVIARYDAVTLEAVRGAARQLLDMGMLSFAGVGKVRTADDYMELVGAASGTPIVGPPDAETLVIQ